MSRRIQLVSPMWPSPESPHTGIFVQNIAEGLERRGFQVDASAVIRGKGQGVAGRARVHAELGARIAAGALRKPDCIYVHAPSWFAPLVSAAARAANAPIAAHLHGGEVYPHSRMEAISKPAVAAFCRRAELVIAPSHYYARETERAFSVRPERLFVSPSGGVDIARFAPQDRAGARSAMGLPEDAEVLGFVGRLVFDKGWDVFLEVLAALRRERPKLVGLVVGGGADVPAFTAEAERLGISSAVKRLDFVPQAELRSAYSSMDVFLFPTRRGAEALGLVPIEAMAAGVPVVGSNGYAVPEYVVEGDTGCLASERDVEAFLRATRRLLDRPWEEVRRMREAALAQARRYARETVADALAARLEKLMG